MLAPLLALLLGDLPAPGPALKAELTRAWAREGGRTWGRPLSGPTLFVDPATRRAWGTEADAGGKLRPEGPWFTGTLPPETLIANTAVAWSGTRWSMVLLPLPDSPEARGVLLLHESWHRLQPSLGLDVEDRACGHLDGLEGRIWLRLEWRALARALTAQGHARRAWAQAALAFRARRHGALPGAQEAERLLELAEGLAEYTGVRTFGRLETLVAQLGREAGPFSRSFAYTSGPAYGLLLDEARPGWTRTVDRNTDLAGLLSKSLGPASLEEVEARLAELGAAKVRQEEEARAAERQARLAALQRRYAEGPTLTVPGPFQLQFNPSNTEGLEDGSAYHPTATYVGPWGRLVVTEGSLRAKDWMAARVIVPVGAASLPVQGPGWTLTLSPGWEGVPTEPAGSWTLRPAAKQD